MAERLTEDAALALLANAAATAATLVVLITALRPISGAHFNPAVTLALRLRGDISSREALAFCAVQVLGAMAGVVLAHLMFGLAPVAWGVAEQSGAGRILSEGIATFGLVAIVLLVGRRRADAVAWSVGLYIGAAYWFTASTSFANPALTLARSLTATFAGIRPANAPAFILAELIGAALAVAAIAWLRRTRPQAESP